MTDKTSLLNEIIVFGEIKVWSNDGVQVIKEFRNMGRPDGGEAESDDKTVNIDPKKCCVSVFFVVVFISFKTGLVQLTEARCVSRMGKVLSSNGITYYEQMGQLMYKERSLGYSIDST